MSGRKLLLALSLTLVLTACQTVEETSVIDSWATATPVRPTALDRTSPSTTRTTLLSNSRGGKSTVIEGSGRFINEPSTGSVGKANDAGDDAITLNLVNVPAPQAAKTILGDILSVKYTVDPSIEGRMNPIPGTH